MFGHGVITLVSSDAILADTATGGDPEGVFTQQALDHALTGAKGRVPGIYIANPEGCRPEAERPCLCHFRLGNSACSCLTPSAHESS